MSTIKDVAKRAGVSPTTISRVLAGKLTARPEKVARVRAAAKSLHYHPSALAQGLITRIVTPPLTTIKPPRQLMGTLAMKTLLHLLRNEAILAEESTGLGPTLMLRQSTASPR